MTEFLLVLLGFVIAQALRAWSKGKLQLYHIHVRGQEKRWSFHFLSDRQHLQDWKEDGLDVAPLYNTIPEWVADLRLVRLWCWLQDWTGIGYGP